MIDLSMFKHSESIIFTVKLLGFGLGFGLFGFLWFFPEVALTYQLSLLGMI